MPRVSPSRNPKYTLTIIGIIVLFILISAIASFCYQMNRPAERQDTGLINSQPMNNNTKAPQTQTSQHSQ